MVRSVSMLLGITRSRSLVARQFTRIERRRWSPGLFELFLPSRRRPTPASQVISSGIVPLLIVILVPVLIPRWKSSSISPAIIIVVLSPPFILILLSYVISTAVVGPFLVLSAPLGSLEYRSGVIIPVVSFPLLRQIPDIIFLILPKSHPFLICQPLIGVLGVVSQVRVQIGYWVVIYRTGHESCSSL